MFRVADLLKMEILHGVKLLSGAGGLENDITGVTIIEAPDIANFVSGGEILLTSLYAFKDCSVEEYETYLGQLSQKKVSALVIKSGRLQTDSVIEKLCTCCEQYAIPLIEIPFALPFRSIMYPVMEHLFNTEVTKLKYFKATHDNFLSLSLATGANGYDHILCALEQLIGNPVALFDNALHCIATTNPSLNTLYLCAQAKCSAATLYAKYQFYRTPIPAGEAGMPACMQYVIPIDVMFHQKMYLAVTETDRLISDLDYIAMENAVTALLLEFSKMYTVSEVERKFNNEILGNILQGKIMERKRLGQLAQQLNLRENAYFQVSVISLSEQNAIQTAGYARQAELNSILCSAIMRVWPHAHIYDQVDSVAVLCETNAQNPSVRCRSALRDAVEQMQAFAAEAETGLLLTAGAGGVVQNIACLSESYRQANEALLLADLVQPHAPSQGRLIPYADLGVIRLLLEFPQRCALRDFVPESLMKLCDYKKNQKNDLLDTLKAYLDYNQNVTKTAQALYVHCKTVIYRVERISEITGIDFNNPDELLSVRMGILILRILDTANRGVIVR